MAQTLLWCGNPIGKDCTDNGGPVDRRGGEDAQYMSLSEPPLRNFTCHYTESASVT